MYKIAWCFRRKQVEKAHSLIIVLKNYSDPFLTKKMVKKGYCGNESMDLAWGRVEVSEMTLFYTTSVSATFLLIFRNTYNQEHFSMASLVYSCNRRLRPFAIFLVYV